MIKKTYENVFPYEITHRYLKNNYQFLMLLKKNIVQLEEIVIY